MYVSIFKAFYNLGATRCKFGYVNFDSFVAEYHQNPKIENGIGHTISGPAYSLFLSKEINGNLTS